MVHLDYELLPSTRVYESRDNKDLYKARLRIVEGGNLTWLATYGTFLGSLILFRRNFKSISYFDSRLANRALAVIVPVYFSFILGRFVHYGAILNLGDLTEYRLLCSRMARRSADHTDIIDNVSMKNYNRLLRARAPKNFIDHPELLEKII